MVYKMGWGIEVGRGAWRVPLICIPNRFSLPQVYLGVVLSNVHIFCPFIQYVAWDADHSAQRPAKLLCAMIRQKIIPS